METAKIKVSVIIPVYNAEVYLAGCIESVLSQGLDEIEVICIDDGSTDGSLRLLQAYAKRDSRVRIIAQANQGAGPARNAGIAAAAGEYLAFLDADDCYEPQALAAAYEWAAKRDLDLLLSGAIYSDPLGRPFAQEPIDEIPLGGAEIFSSEDVPGYLFQIASCNTWNKLYKREFVNRHNLEFQAVKTANDLAFVYSAMACARRISVFDMPLVNHRVLREGNLQSIKKSTPMDFLEALLLLKQRIQEAGLWTLLRQSYLNCALYHCGYNYRTLDTSGKRTLRKNAPKLYELLELDIHPKQYYYDETDYEIIGKLITPSGRKEALMFARLKNLLKRILPPPVNAFNREIRSLRRYMRELDAGAESRQKQQQKSGEALAEKLLEKIEILEETQSVILEKLLQLERENQCLSEKIQRISDIAIMQDHIKDHVLENRKVLNTLEEKIEEAGNLMPQIYKKSVENGAHISEALWSEIFNNVIANSTWLHDAAFAAGRWAVGYPYLYAMYRVLNEARPKRILELGLGQSTKMISQYAAATEGVEHIIVESDPNWIDFFKQSVELSKTSKIVQLEYEMTAYKEAKYVRVFKGFKDLFMRGNFDFISLDAPYSADMKQYARIDILSILPEGLSDNFVIMMDDCHRIGEARTLIEIEKVLQENRLPYKRGNYSGIKDCVLLCAEHMKFLSTM